MHIIVVTMSTKLLLSTHLSSPKPGLSGDRNSGEDDQDQARLAETEETELEVRKLLDPGRFDELPTTPSSSTAQQGTCTDMNRWRCSKDKYAVK